MLSYCPEGSAKLRDFSGVLACVLIDSILFIIVILVRSIKLVDGEKKKLIHHESDNDQQDIKEKSILNSPFGLARKVTFSKKPKKEKISSEFENQDIIDAFKSSMNGHDIRIHLKFHDMTLTLPSGLTILDRVTGEIEPGRFTAIIGPSGCGSNYKLTIRNYFSQRCAR
jgi:ABC-type multidrug transport system fused ATPase/permease subunit